MRRKTLPRIGSKRWRAFLVDEGAARLMKLADPQQEVFDRGFILENAGSGVVRADLSMNCRNTHAVARVVARFGGAEAAPASPDGQPVEFLWFGLLTIRLVLEVW